MQLNKNPRHLEVTQGTEKVTLFMSYGKLSRIVNLVDGPDGWAQAASRTDLQEAVLREMFTKRNKEGEVTSQVQDLESLEVDLDDIERIFEWVGGHIIDFFTRRVEKSMEQVNESRARLEKLMPTKIGTSP